jgi:hypothetical protein
MGIFYSPRIPTNGLVFAVDPANSKSYSGSGTTWTDLTESRNNATLQNTPTFNSTNNQGTFSFDGVNERASFAFTNLPVGSSAGTMCAWAKSSLASQTKYVISYGSNPGAQGEWRGLLQLGTQFFFTGFGLEASGGTVIQNVWHFWTGVYDGTNAILYADGVLLQSIARAWSTVTTGGTPNIGATPTSSSTWNGEISQCLIYNRALSAEEILQIYNATRGRFGK